MIISDLQYIESVDANIQGGHDDHDDHNGGHSSFPIFITTYSSFANAGAGAEAFGQYTSAVANTGTFTAPGVSKAGSSSTSSSSGFLLF